MTPNHLRKTLRPIEEKVDEVLRGKDLDALQEFFAGRMLDVTALMIAKDILHSIAQGRCTDPKTCAVEFSAFVERMEEIRKTIKVER